jgi:hypothetical protein
MLPCNRLTLMNGKLLLMKCRPSIIKKKTNITRSKTNWLIFRLIRMTSKLRLTMFKDRLMPEVNSRAWVKLLNKRQTKPQTSRLEHTNKNKMLSKLLKQLSMPLLTQQLQNTLLLRRPSRRPPRMPKELMKSLCN